MARPPVMDPDEKAKIVLAVLAGDLSLAQAARQAAVSEQSVGNWRRQFVSAGRLGLAGGDRQANEHERRLREQIVELKVALGEAYFQLRELRKQASYFPGRPGGIRTARSPVLQRDAVS